MYCLNCGSQMAEGSKFCISCGSKYEKSEPVQETAAQEAAASVESTAVVEEIAETAPQPAAPQPVQQTVPQPAAPQPVQQTVSQPAASQPVQQAAQPAQATQPRTEQSAFAQPAPKPPVQPVQQQNHMNGPQQTVPQPVMPLKPEKVTPLPVWKYIGIFLIMGIPILGIVMLFVWAFGSSFNRNTKNYARAVLIFSLIMLILTAVGYFTIWSDIQEIMSNMNLPIQFPITD